MIIKEWKCLDCETFFESSDADPACPQCTAAEPERVFLTPPAIKSPQTAFKDHAVRDLAQSYGLSDMSNKDGQPIKGQRGPKQAHAAWGGDQTWLGRAAAAPGAIVDGPGFRPPRPQYVGKVKET